MKLLCLNIWGGRQGQPLFNYIKEQSETTDIFCFQEIFNAAEEVNASRSTVTRIHLLRELKNLLPNFESYYSIASKNHDNKGPVDFPITHGLGIFTKKEFKVTKRENFIIFGHEDNVVDPDFTNLSCILQNVEITTAEGAINIFNYHGIAMPGDKLDTPLRLEQSEKIMKILKGVSGPKILCGDFNLMPETESIKILEIVMKNLIKDFNIKATRNKVSQALFPENPQFFADFTFVSDDIKIKSFEVPYNEVSDHLPMVLNFEF